MSDGPSAPQVPAKKKGKAPPHAWKPGQSGNPKGRPNQDAPIREALNRCGIDAVNTLHELLGAEHEPRVRCSAARHILDFTTSKPREVDEPHQQAEAVISALAALLTQPKG